MTSLMDHAQRIARSAIKADSITLGPWLGSMRSVPADQVPKEYLAAGSDFHYLPRHGYWRRRKGQTQKFDTFGASVGLLPAKWGAKCRQLAEFKSESISDAIPTVCALETKETTTSPSVLDDGRFSTFWVRDQVNNVNYTLGVEYGATYYPPPGSVQPYKVVPLWYESGQGGLTRGTSELARRFFLSGSRDTEKVQNWRYAPSRFGTPSRWREMFAPTSTYSATDQVFRPTSVTAAGGGAASIAWGRSGGGAFSGAWADVDDTATDIATQDDDYATYTLGLGFGDGVSFVLGTTPPIAGTSYILHLTLRSSTVTAGGGTPNDRMIFTLTNTGGATIAERDYGFAGHVGPPTPDEGNVSNGFAKYTITLTAPEIAAITFASTLSLTIQYSGIPESATFDIAEIDFTIPGSGGSVVTLTNRLMPSGPIPPVHAGTIEARAADLVEDSNDYLRPDADITISPAGSWTTQAGGATNLFQTIDDLEINDADYVTTTAGASPSGSYYEMRLADFGFIPSSDSTVSIVYRMNKFTDGQFRIDLVQGSTVKASKLVTVLQTQFTDQSFNLTSTEISSITDWTDLRIRLVTTVAGNATTGVRVSYITMLHSQSEAELSGGWRGSDKFYYGVAYRAWDDSIWMPTTPRGPNDLLPNGLNLFQVNAANPSAGYRRIFWTNLPVPLFEMKELVLVRSLKIDATTDSILQLNIKDLRVVGFVKPGVTEFEDTFADDDVPVFDPDELFIRDDHRMPPRTYFISGGDSRVLVSNGTEGPCAIGIAPVSHTSATAWDLNLSDTDVNAYTAAHAMYMRIIMDGAGAMTLTLNHSDGTTVTTSSFAFATYTTLEKLVDAINATTVAGGGKMWRAQICPNVNSQAPSSTLFPHIRTISSCVVAGQTITKTGVNAVAVGAMISGTGVTDGAYITSIDSATQLTFSGTITAGTKDLNFFFELGDRPVTAGAISGTTNAGYQRVICNAYPAFLYFNKDYLDTFPNDTAAAWMTVGTPGAAKSAANCFSGEPANKFTPPRDIGVAMGAFAVDKGFVTPYAKARAVISNDRDQGTGNDPDYHIYILSNTGCISWASVAGGTRAGVYAAAEGIILCDLKHEKLISGAIYHHAKSDAVDGVGDFLLEAKLSAAATAMGVDNAYLSCHVLRGAVWVNYRAVSTTHPDRQVVYDFSEGTGEGAAAMLRPNGEPWGWSLPLTRSVTAMCEVTRSDGTHLYGFNEANAGSTGDGRIDEIEVGDLDNGAAISATPGPRTGWFQFGDDNLAAHEVTIWHKTPTAAIVAVTFARTLFVSSNPDTYTLTMSSTSTPDVIRDLKALPSGARVTAAAVYLAFSQVSGSAAELRGFSIKLKRLKNFRLALAP